MKPATKQAKMCADINRVQAERKLKFKTTRELLSFSLSTNVSGINREILNCREDDSDEAIKKLVESFLN